MPTRYWFEGGGVPAKIVAAFNEDQAVEAARAVYPADDDDHDPERWLFMRRPGDDEDYVLVPGGPACEEFTWMPRSMWAAGGPIAVAMEEG